MFGTENQSLEPEVNNTPPPLSSIDSAASSKEQFYTSENQSQGTHGGWINNPDTAREIATVEKTQGRDTALKFEEIKKKDFETGLTESQKINNEYLNILKENFPNAFRQGIQRINNGEELEYQETGGILFSKNYDEVIKLEQTRAGQTYYHGNIDSLSEDMKGVLNEIVSIREEVNKIVQKEGNHWGNRILESMVSLHPGPNPNFVRFSKEGISMGNVKTSFEALPDTTRDLLLRELAILDKFVTLEKKEEEEKKPELTPDSLRQSILKIKGEID